MHLFLQCRFTKRIWVSLKTWLGLYDLDIDAWDGFSTLEEWWTEVVHKKGDARKGLASLAMLVDWEIWLERNTRVFQNKSMTTTMLINKIKEEAEVWGRAGAKALCNFVPRE